MALAREAQPEYRELVREQGRPPIRRPRADIGRARGAYRPRSNAGVGGAGAGSGSSSSSESEELSDNIPAGFGGQRGRRGAIQHLRFGAIPPHLMNPAQLNPPGGLRMEYTERYSRRTPMMNSDEANRLIRDRNPRLPINPRMSMRNSDEATRLMRERNPRLPVVPRAHRTIEEIFEDAKAEKEEKKQAKVEIRNMFLDKQEPLKPGTVEERMAFRARLKGMSLFPNTFNAPMILQGY
jgi:hypothetical protein